MTPSLVAESSLALLFLLLPFSKAAIQLLFPVLLIAWVLLRRSSGWRASVWSSPAGRWCLAALAGYLAACALSVIGSTHPDLSLRGLIRKTAEYALWFVLAADVARKPSAAQRCVGLLLIGAAVVWGDALIQAFTGHDPLRGHAWFTYHRMTGPYENPNDLATFIAVVMPIGLLQLPVQTGWRRWTLAALMLCLLAVLVRIESQGGWLSFGVGVLVVMALDRQLRRPLLWLTAAFSVCALIYLAVVGRLVNSVQLSDVSSQDRWFMWQSAWRMIQERPWFGQGLNTFMANYLDFWIGGEQQPRYAHNCYLQIAAETGWIGLSMFVLLLGSMMRIWWQALRRLEGAHPSRLLMLGLAAGLTGFAVQAVVDTNFYSLRQVVLFWTLAGLLTGLSLDSRQAIPVAR